MRELHTVRCQFCESKFQLPWGLTPPEVLCPSCGALFLGGKTGDGEKTGGPVDFLPSPPEPELDKTTLPVDPSWQADGPLGGRHPSLVFELFQGRYLRRSLDLEKPSPEDPALVTHDRYTMIKPLAQGGMGQVDLIKDHDLNRLVARKSLLPEFNSRAGVMERFVEEAQATGQLEHPNIVPVHDVGLDDQGHVYFTMKYIKGQTLQEVLSAVQRGDSQALEAYSLHRLLQVYLQICNAVAFAHAKGVIHRDLKPGNVMLGPFGEVIVMDWGVAKVMGSDFDLGAEGVETLRQRTGTQTMLGTVLGTPAYMPPEQALGEIAALDQRSDIYSLGAILYEILSLNPPYSGPDAQSIITAVITQPVEPPESKARPYHRLVPRELSAIALKALAKDQSQRYGAVEDLGRDIQCFLEGKEVSALPDSMGKKVRRWSGRNRSTLGWALLLMVLTVAGILGTRHYLRYTTVSRFLADGDRLQNLALAEGNKHKPIQSLNPYATSSLGLEKVMDLYRKAAEQYRKVLDTDPENGAAKQALADVSFSLWGLAGREGNVKLMSEYRSQVAYYMGSAYPGSSYATRITGAGNLTLQSTPSGAEVFLFQMEQAEDSRLIPVPCSGENTKADEKWLQEWNQGKISKVAPFEHSVYSLPLEKGNLCGTTPLEVSCVLPGSYLAVLRHPGFLPQRVPFVVERLEDKNFSVTLVSEEGAAEGFTYVPRLPFEAGGTSAGAGSFREAVAGGLFLKTMEVSLGEYAVFLEDLVRNGEAEEARARLPRDFGWKLLELDPQGKVVPSERLEQGWPDTPARGVSYLDAKAYIAWKGARDGHPYRLPTEDEWELAARGADGRKYSWGNEYRLEFARLTQGYGEVSAAKIEELNLLGNFKDESVFGLRDMAGGVAEWVEGFFDPAVTADGPGVLRVIRGNAWGLTPIGLECAFRTSGPPDYFHSTIGFRYGFRSGE